MKPFFYLLAVVICSAYASPVFAAGDEDVDVAYGADVSCGGALLEAAIGLDSTKATSNVNGNWSIRVSKNADGQYTIQSGLNGRQSIFNSSSSLSPTTRSRIYDTAVAGLNHLDGNGATSADYCRLKEAADSACQGQFQGIPRMVIDRGCSDSGAQ